MANENDDILENFEPGSADPLSGEEEESSAVPQETDSEPENQENEPAAETTGENDAAPPAAQEVNPSQPPEEGEWVPRSALEDERRKRQELEAQKAAASDFEVPSWARKMREAQTGPQAPKMPDGMPTVFDAEGNPVDLGGLIGQAVQPLHEQITNMSENLRLDASERAAMERHDDFPQAMDGFRYEAILNPSIVEQARRMEDPAEFAYQVGVRRMAMERAAAAPHQPPIQQQQMSQPPQPQPGAAQPKPSLPESLSDRAAPGPARVQAPAPDDPLDDVGTHFMR